MKDRVKEKNPGAKIRDSKRRGEWVEMRFMARAAENGLQVNKPWGDSASFDFVVGNESQFLRVQVKSTKYKQGNGYRCGLVGRGRPYAATAFDFLAAYVIPEDVWYIMPMREVRGRRCVHFYPKYEGAKNGKYKEAWELLRGASVNSLSRSKSLPGKIANIKACNAPTYAGDVFYELSS